MARFTKPSLTIPQKIARLQAQGMIVPNVAQAEHMLQHISYYRLSAYWLPFEHPKGQPGPRFRPGTDFDTVVDLYEFDRKLRLLVMDAIERIEVALRGSWALNLAHQGGPHGYLSASLYSDRRQFHENLSRLTREAGISPEPHIEHYRQTYDDPAMPPVWMVTEIMAFGQLSRWYSSLSDRALRNKIAVPLGLPERVLVPLVKHLSTLRNTCAHHGRLWNRGFLIRPILPQKPPNLAATLEPAGPGPALIYNSLVLMIFLLSKVDPGSGWRGALKAHLATHPTGALATMGFPQGWVQRPLWF
jgi:abortive infection bacteriophage resistance protein